MVMDKNAFFRALKKMDFEVFALANKMNDLSLGDSGSSSTSSSGSSGSSGSGASHSSFMQNYMSSGTILNRFKSSKSITPLTRKIMEFTQKPFMDIPQSVPSSVRDMDSNANDSHFSLGFRFMPGQEQYAVTELKMPKTYAGLKGLRDKIGLTLSRDSLSEKATLKLANLSGLKAKGEALLDRVLLEAITYNEGYYARFVILVQIGVGLTIWYGYAPGDPHEIPIAIGESTLFSPITNYEPFFYNPEVYVHEGFQKMILMDNKEQTLATLANAYTVEKPFSEITIPDSKSNFKVAICLGIVVIVLLTAGISPIVDSL